MDTIFIETLKFVSEKHIFQKRKGYEPVPYINHLIRVTYILHNIGNETDLDLLCASLLHDTIEDTDTTKKEIAEKFGNAIAEIVMEVTDDMSLSYEERKRQQINKAASLSINAKKIKIADKIANIEDILSMPLNWSNRRKRQYVMWSQQVIANCRGVNKILEKAFDEIVNKALNEIEDDISN